MAQAQQDRHVVAYRGASGAWWEVCRLRDPAAAGRERDWQAAQRGGRCEVRVFRAADFDARADVTGRAAA